MRRAKCRVGKWWTFIRERFEPVSHLAMVSLFFLAHLRLFPERSSSISLLVLLGVGVLLFFFKLRLYDELKDYETDLAFNPGRPLARGLVVHRDLYRGIVFCIVVEILCFAPWGNTALSALGVAIFYSLLMYKEFFMPKLIRPHLTTYALSHTVVSALLSLSIIFALTGATSFSAFPLCGWYFAGTTWALFNVFEFGRKTFASIEERDGVASYSKIFGRWGAITLVGIMSGIAQYGFERASGAVFLPGRIVLVALVGAGFLYAFFNRKPWGRIYRTGTSFYIVIIYLFWCVLSEGSLC